MVTTGFAENQEDSLRASSVRVALGLFSVVALPLFAPPLLHFEWVLVAYAACAVGFQVAIRRGFGGVARVLLGGTMDVAFITFLVHRLGTQSTPLIASYVLAAMFNALVVAPWAARVLGALGVVAYTAVSCAEALRWLPYAPDVPELTGFVPSLASALRAAVVVATLVSVSAWVSDRIARALRFREQQFRDANTQLEHLSQRDPLTQLYNRRYFVRRAEEELLRMHRGHPMAILMMDLDRFKHVNDEQGHLAGDELLRRIAVAIVECTRAIDVVGRFGGDEFVALLPDTDAEQALIVAERLVRTVRQVGTEADPRRPVTASLGLAIAQPEDSLTMLLSAADEGAYRAKQAGGDRVHLELLPKSEVTPRQSGFRAAKAG